MKKNSGQAKSEVGVEDVNETLQQVTGKIHEPDLPILRYDDFGMEETRIKLVFPQKNHKDS